MELVNFACKTCGASLSGLVAKSADGLVTCPFCGNVWTIPKQDIRPDALQFLRMGEHDLDTGKFDDAYAAYKKASELDPKEPEAYFGMALAEFKIQYLKDHVNNRVQPICYEVTNKKFTDSNTYLRALINATPAQKTEYERKGAEIDYILGEFYKLKQSGLDYDCFICVKVTDDTTKQLTEDSKDADYIYRLLQDKGFKPFFSERELRSVTGADYEARILYALSTSECMLVVCRDESYLQTPWVKNEYMRFLKLMNDEEKESDSITIVFYGTPIEKLPGKNGKLQGINFALREADGKIVDFVESHTPEAKARREKEKSRKAEAEQETAKRFRELEEQIKRMANAQTAPMPTQTQSTEAEQETAKRFQKLEEQIKRMANAQTAPMPPQTQSTDIGKFEVKNNEIVRYKGTDSVVVIPYGVTSIGKSAFSGCKSLTSITIPNSVTSIGEHAFAGCESLKNIILPKNVTSIGNTTFIRCTELETLVVEEGNPNYYSQNNCIIEKSTKKLVLGCKNSIIPKDVKAIDPRAFTGSKNFEPCPIEEGNPVFYLQNSCIINKNTNELVVGYDSSIIPGNISSIGESAFMHCAGLKSITIPNSVTSIGEQAFGGCASLTSIEIPNSVTSIGKGAFWGCKSLTSVTILDGIKSIGEYEFSDCKSLTSIEIPNSVTSIGGHAFWHCESLTSIVLPNSVTSIGGDAFNACKNLTSITIPNSVTSIGEHAFWNCTNLTSITIPNSVTSIGEHAFWNCTNLTSITIPKSVKSIGKDTFGGCENLISINIPNSVKSIGEHAFLCCRSMTSAIFESTKGWVYNRNNSSVRISENELSDPSSAAQCLKKYSDEWSQTATSEPSTQTKPAPAPVAQSSTSTEATAVKAPAPATSGNAEPKKEEPVFKKKEGFFSRFFGKK